jgi:hypothetical protein
MNTKGALIVFVLFALVLPVAALAADNFIPLAPIPGLSKGQYSDVSAYLNAVFNLAISVAAVLAVIMIIFHGIQYMTKESVTETKDHLIGIRSAVTGLILLLLSWLILFVINPQILDLNALKSSLGATPSSSAAPAPSTSAPPASTAPSNTAPQSEIPWYAF